jgi:hypothetical protein
MIEFAVTPRHPLPMLRITLPCRAHSRKHARVVSAADRMPSETPPPPPQERGNSHSCPLAQPHAPMLRSNAMVVSRMKPREKET